MNQHPMVSQSGGMMMPQGMMGSQQQARSTGMMMSQSGMMQSQSGMMMGHHQGAGGGNMMVSSSGPTLIQQQLNSGIMTGSGMMGMPPHSNASGGGMMMMGNVGGQQAQQQHMQHPHQGPPGVGNRRDQMPMSGGPPGVAQPPQPSRPQRPEEIVRELAPALKDKWSNCIRDASDAVQQNSLSDPSKHDTASTKFEWSLENFHSTLDQLELNAKCANETLQQAQASARYMPGNLNYHQYITTARMQISFTNKIKDMLNAASKGLLE